MKIHTERKPWEATRSTTHAHLQSEYLEILSPLHDADWNLIVDEESEEFAAAMEQFTDALIAAGWTWERWLYAEEQDTQAIRAFERERRRVQASRQVRGLRKQLTGANRTQQAGL